MRKIYISILVCLFFSTACAQEDSDSLFFTTPLINIFSNRISQNYEDSFVPVQLFDREQINNTIGSQVSDVLRKANSVFIKSYGGVSALKTISINGMNAEHTLILLNGTRLNTVQNSQFDLSLISNDDIESIEVMPSGGSSFFGSDAMSGVVNIMTYDALKSVQAKTFSGSVYMNAGSYNYKNYGVSLKFDKGNHTLKTSLFSEKSDDDFDYLFFNGAEYIDKKRTNNSFTKNDALVQYSYKEKNNIINLVTFYNNKERHIPGLESGNEPMNAVQTDQIWNSIFNLEHTLLNKNVIRASLNFQNYLMKYAAVPSDDSYYKNLSASSSFSYQFNWSRAKLLAGTDYLVAGIKSNELQEDKIRNVISVFSNFEYKILNNLFIYPSVRFENISDINKNVITSKFGLNYKPLDNGLIILRGSAGNSFRAPTFNELYWKTGGNENLLPEKSFSLDFGLMSEFELFGFNTFELNYNHLNADNKILWKPTGNYFWTPVNVASSESDVLSVNLSSRKNINDRTIISVNAGYSHNLSRKTSEDYPGDPSLNKQLIYIPVDMIKFNAEFQYMRTGLNIFGYSMGKRYTNYENTLALKPAFIMDAGIFTNIRYYSVNARIAFEVSNLTNTDYQIVSGYPMPLRNFKILLTLSY